MSWLRLHWIPPLLRRILLVSMALIPLIALQTPVHAETSYPGEGKRVVYSRSERQVWLVKADGTLSATWKVTGHPTIPSAGTYNVYSRSMTTRTIDGKYTFNYMVRFARSQSGLGIGFHALPYDSFTKAPIMPPDKIGLPGYSSSGCVRQSLMDAQRMWAWARMGTEVIVLN